MYSVPCKHIATCPLCTLKSYSVLQSGVYVQCTFADFLSFTVDIQKSHFVNICTWCADPPYTRSVGSYKLLENNNMKTDDISREYMKRVIISGAQSSWRSVTSSVPQGSIVGPMPSKIFINDVDNGANCKLVQEK